MYSYLFTEVKLESLLLECQQWLQIYCATVQTDGLLMFAAIKVCCWYSTSTDRWLLVKEWAERSDIGSSLGFTVCMWFITSCAFCLSLFFFQFLCRLRRMFWWVEAAGTTQGTVAILVPSLVGDYRAEVREAHLDNRVLFGTVQG